MNTQGDWSSSAVLANQIGNMNLQATRVKAAAKNDEEQALSLAEVSLMNKNMGLVENKNEVEVDQAASHKYLSPSKTFEGLSLSKELLSGVYAMGFRLPSKIQERALPTLLASPPHNLIAQSQSGTGKTAAFSLALLSKIDTSKNCVQALCLSPTYELALQTANTIKELGKYCTDIRIRYAVKGEQIPRGQQITEHIVIGTPGKVVDWATKIKVLDLSNCIVFVLDEADVMIATQGHQDQSVRIHRLLPPICQMMLFSATYDESVMIFAEAIIPNPVTMRLKREEETLKNITQRYVECCSAEEKYTAIANIYAIPVGQAMIFCKTKLTAHWLTTKMQKDGHHVAVLTGDLTPEERLRVLNGYRKGEERVLICTNVLARGIDVIQVTLVVNYDLPEVEGQTDCETYLHRIGRTGRFGRKGIAINMVDGQRAHNMLRDIEEHFGIRIPKFNYKNLEEIENLARCVV